MTTRSKERRAGYQGKSDAMREMADKLMNHPGHTPDVILSKSAPSLEKRRPYQKGGAVKKQRCQKFAIGGVARIRLGAANAKGLPLPQRKKKGKS
jgi:hypothetical protein